jgi:hypothetical protein
VLYFAKHKRISKIPRMYFADFFSSLNGFRMLNNFVILGYIKAIKIAMTLPATWQQKLA